MNFEEAIKELEQIVEKLEQGELTLEQSLDMFQRGVALSNLCAKMLDEAEQKVSILIKNKDGTVVKQAFTGNQEDCMDGF